MTSTNTITGTSTNTPSPSTSPGGSVLAQANGGGGSSSGVSSGAAAGAAITVIVVASAGLSFAFTNYLVSASNQNMSRRVLLRGVAARLAAIVVLFLGQRAAEGHADAGCECECTYHLLIMWHCISIECHAHSCHRRSACPGPVLTRTTRMTMNTN
jgi:hypothetical protein